MITLQLILAVSVVVFATGFAILLTRTNAVVMLLGIEIMLGAANLNLLAFWRYGPDPAALDGVIFVLFTIAVAAGEAAVGLALIVFLYRHFKTVRINSVRNLHG